MQRRLAILGSTGSIGTQALSVVREHPGEFKVEMITANSSVDLLISQALEFRPTYAAVCNPDVFPKLCSALEGSAVKPILGMDAICEKVAEDSVDMALTALVGFSGLRPTIAAIKARKPIALANKETLVAGGAYVMPLAAKMGVPILPVDSEHSAIFQCLLCAGGNKISKIHLTASGGPFRTWKKEDIAKATAAQALRHPRWDMGAKITIDSSTLMNKGFEMIEARWLFDTAPSDINIVVHPQSIIHSMVEYEDGEVIAQLSEPDMRGPIQFALSFPRRLPLSAKKMDFATLGSLTFEKPDFDKFPCLGLAFKAAERGGNVPCAMNAANEAAVAAYLRGDISFYGIAEVVSKFSDEVPFVKDLTEENLIATNDDTFRRAADYIAARRGTL